MSTGPTFPPLNETTYQVVVARRAVFDQMVWQAPTLSFTAQAFLFTISLGADSSRFARIVASLLSLLVSILSIQLMARHRAFEVYDAETAHRFEVDQGWTPAHSVRELGLTQGPAFVRWLATKPSFAIWTWGLTALGLTSLVTLVLAVVAPRVFLAPG